MTGAADGEVGLSVQMFGHRQLFASAHYVGTRDWLSPQRTDDALFPRQLGSLSHWVPEDCSPAVSEDGPRVVLKS